MTYCVHVLFTQDKVISSVTQTSSAPQRGIATGREFIALITALMASSALAIDLMLPAFPNMRQEFNMPADSTQVAWIITAFFLGMAAGPWLYGPISDRYGRRRPLYAGMSLYVLSALLASVAPSWGWIIFARVLWGLGAAAPRSLSVAMIRDRYEGDAMARLMSMIMAVFLLVPIIAPSFGASIISIAPWRMVFLVPAIFGVIIMLWARRLPETLSPDRRRPFTWTSVSQASKEVLTNRQTVSFSIAVTFLFACMTTYLAGSEVILEDVYDYGHWFPVFFGVIAILFAINSLNNARLVQRLGLSKLVRRLSLLVTSTSIIFLVISFSQDGRPSFWLFAISIACVMPIAQGLVPNCNTAAMTPLPHIAGTASALIATFTTAGGALLGGLANSYFDGTLRPIAIAITTFVLLATICIFFGTKSSTE